MRRRRGLVALRPPLTVALLLASLALTALLARQGYGAARSHRVTVETVLRDYAALAAGELVRRATSEVGYSGYYPAITVISQGFERGRESSPDPDPFADRRPGPGLPSPEELSAGAGEPTARALELARTVFRLDPASERLEQAGPPLAPELAGWLAAELPRLAAAAGAAGEPFSGAQAVVGGQAWTLVYTAPPDDEPVTGFVVDREALARRLGEVVAAAPLLPPSLGAAHGPSAAPLEGSREAVLVRVLDPAGRELLRSPAASATTAFGVEHPFGDGYQGIFRGYVVEAAIDPRAAPELVIGGLPRSRLPELAGLLALSVGLTAAAILQLRRERALARTRSDFVSRVSHELRTPLTQIRMFAETLLLGRVRSADERRRALEIIDREARRLGALVETVLQFSRAERGSVHLAPARVELAPLVAGLVRELGPLLEAAGVEVRLAVASDPVAVVDEDALRQMLLNLLDNAVRHGGRDRGEVMVELGTVGPNRGTAGDRVYLAVDDAGPGIPAAERERIWEPFYRGAAAARVGSTGTGIGLAVVRDLVERHGGEARVEESRRGGARFVVELPGAGVGGEARP